MPRGGITGQLRISTGRGHAGRGGRHRSGISGGMGRHQPNQTPAPLRPARPNEREDISNVCLLAVNGGQ